MIWVAVGLVGYAVSWYVAFRLGARCIRNWDLGPVDDRDLRFAAGIALGGPFTVLVFLSMPRTWRAEESDRPSMFRKIAGKHERRRP